MTVINFSDQKITTKTKFQIKIRSEIDFFRSEITKKNKVFDLKIDTKILIPKISKR